MAKSATKSESGHFQDREAHSAGEQRIKTKRHQGEQVFFEWRAPEFRNLKKIRSYLKVFMMIELALFLWALYNSNFLFAIFILIASLVILFVSWDYRPKNYHFRITDSGIWVEEKLHPFIELKYFSVSPHTASKEKFFVFQRNKGGEIRIPVPSEQAEKIRLLVNRYVPQAPYKPSFLDALDKMFH